MFMKERQVYVVLGLDGEPLPIPGYYFCETDSKDDSQIYITIGKNPTAIPWSRTQLVPVPQGSAFKDALAVILKKKS